MNQKEIYDIFDNYNAIWVHNGEATMPHAELTTGLCSNGFINCREVLKYTNICKKLSEQLYYKVLREVVLRNVNLVVGSPYSAITFSYQFAALSGKVHGFTEKDPSDPKGKKMVWKGGLIRAEEKVLQVEELITTSSTFFEVRRAMQQANPESINFLPFVACIVHRPQNLSVNYNGIKIISLIEKEIWSVKPEDCPLCKAGSKRLRPRGNWAELTGKKTE